MRLNKLNLVFALAISFLMFLITSSSLAAGFTAFFIALACPVLEINNDEK